MATVYEEILSSGGIAEDVDGFTDTRVFIVSGLNPRIGVRYEALKHPDIPKRREKHPDIPGIEVVRRQSTSLSGSSGKVQVTIEYGTPPQTQTIDRSQPFGEVTWSGSVRSEAEERLTDADGDPLLVRYQGRPVLDELNSKGEIVTGTGLGFFRYSFVHSADIDRPLMTLQAERWERDDPEDNAARYQGHTNALTWRTYAPETMLIREIAFDPDQENGGYNVRYVFVYDRRTWRLEKSLKIASSLGFQTPGDANVPNGISRFKMYPTLSFTSALGL